MYCKTCGKENPEGTIECSTCGCNVNEGNMYCPQCGHFCLPGDSQCVNCGCELSEDVSLKMTIPSVAVEETVEPVPPIPQEQQYEPEPVSVPEPEPAPEPAAAPQFDSLNQKYCRNCGLTIDASALRCPNCDSLENSASKYCPNCGMITTPQDTSCAYCGAVFQGTPYEAQSQTQQETIQQQPVSQGPSYQQPQGPSYQQPQGQQVPPYISVQTPSVTYNNNTYNNYNSTRTTIPTAQHGDRSFLVTLLLCLFVGYLGVHRFYTKNYIAGIIQLLTGGMCGIWWLIDLILIAVGTYRDGDGLPLQKDI